MRPVAFRTPAAASVLLVAVSLVGGCGTDEPPAARLDGLLLLAGDAGGADLRTWRGDASADGGEPVIVPDGTTWVAAGRADVLVVSLADGSLRISDRIRADEQPTWREPKAALATGDQAAGPFDFPTWDPEGGRLAALAGDLEGGPRLTLIDPSVGSAFEIELGGPVAAAPPAWVGPDLVALVAGPDEAPRSILVDTTTGDVTSGRSDARLLATSADGETLAVSEGDDQPVIVRSTAAWLEDRGTILAIVDPPENAVAATSMALDATGDRLAVAWLDSGGTIRVEFYDGTLEWRRVAGPSAGDAAGVVLAWFR